MRSAVSSNSCGQRAAQLFHEIRDGAARAFAQHAAIDIHAAHARVSGERNEVGFVLRHFAAAQTVLLFGQNDNGAALGSFVRQARKLRSVGQFVLRSRPGTAMNSTACRLPSVMVPVLSSSSVLISPEASTALPLIASTLCCITRSMPAMPIAESSPPMVVGIRQTSSETSTAMRGHASQRRLSSPHKERKDATWRRPAERSASGRQSEYSARSHWASSAVRRLPPGQSSCPEKSRPDLK